MMQMWLLHEIEITFWLNNHNIFTLIYVQFYFGYKEQTS